MEKSLDSKIKKKLKTDDPSSQTEKKSIKGAEKKNSDRHVHFDEDTIEKSKKDEKKTSTIFSSRKIKSKEQEAIAPPESRTKNLEPSNTKKTWLDNSASETKQFKTGKFSREELNKLMQSICEYVSVNQKYIKKGYRQPIRIMNSLFILFLNIYIIFLLSLLEKQFGKRRFS